MSVIESGFFYLFIIFFSLVFVFMSEQEFKKRRRTAGIMLLCIAILIPCFIASVRGLRVGADISVYITNNFLPSLCNKGFISYYRNMPLKTDLLFAMLQYLFAKLNWLGGLFFVVELLSIALVYYVLYKHKNEGSLTISIFLFYIMFFNISLCVMRGSISQAFLFLAYYFYDEGNIKKSIMVSIIAVLFHTTALIPLVFFVLVIGFDKRGWKKSQVAIFALALIIFFLFYRRIIVGLVPLIGHIEQRYAARINRYLIAQQVINVGDISYGDLLSKCILLMIAIYCGRKTKENRTKESKTQIVLSIVGRYFSLFSVNFYESIRIGFFFDYALLLYVPRSMKKMRLHNRAFFYSVIIVLMLAYWWFMYVISNSFYTVPFAFRWSE